MTSQLFHFPEALPRDPQVEAWFDVRPAELGDLARQWFAVMRRCGPDVRELLHDLHPNACAGEAAFGYVNAFTTHVNVGFFRGAELPDPKRLLEGNGKFMRHVKLKPGVAVDESALNALIEAAYRDMQVRVAAEAGVASP